MRHINYLPIETLFNLLSICRRQVARSNQAIRAAMRRRGLYSTTHGTYPAQQAGLFSFWLRLAKSASLLDDNSPPYPSLLADDWVGWPYPAQMDHLLNAWMRAPQSEYTCTIRMKLWRHLREGLTLASRHRRQLVGLYTLGICADGELSELGSELFKSADSHQFTELVPEPWQILEERLIIPFPPDWKLLWELEFYLDPIAPGVYSLDSKALRLASQRESKGPIVPLQTIFQRGLDKAPPGWLINRMASQPVIQVIQGPVLEFSNQEELKKLRRTTSMRRDLGRMFSSRHVSLNLQTAKSVLKRLQNKGLISEHDLFLYELSSLSTTQFSKNSRKQKSIDLSISEKTYLLSLMFYAAGLEHPISPPPGLLSKLCSGLDQALIVSAGRKANDVFAHNQINPAWHSEDEFPKAPEGGLLEFLQAAIDLEESVDVLYQVSGRHSMEYRHLTPLLLEQRGDRFYLIAYCHLRRAQRTFRLDRLKLASTSP